MPRLRSRPGGICGGGLTGLRFFADHCVSNEIIRALREVGHEVVRLKDHLPTEARDALVTAKAQELDAIGDFADIVAYPPARFKSIVALQVLDHPEATGALIARLIAYSKTHPAKEHYRGKLIIVEPRRVRTRR